MEKFKFSAIIIVLLSSVFIFSCQKSDNPTILPQMERASLDLIEANKSTIDNFKKLSQEEMKVAWNALKADESQAILLNHFSEFIGERKCNFQQLAVVKSLEKSLLTTNIDDQNALNQLKAFEENWLKEAKQVFTINEIYLLAYTLQKYTDKELDVIKAENGHDDRAISDCNCNFGSYFACVYQPYKCQKKSCYVKKGCGFLILWSCNAKCNIFM